MTYCARRAVYVFFFISIRYWCVICDYNSDSERTIPFSSLTSEALRTLTKHTVGVLLGYWILELMASVVCLLTWLQVGLHRQSSDSSTMCTTDIPGCSHLPSERRFHIKRTAPSKPYSAAVTSLSERAHSLYPRRQLSVTSEGCGHRRQTLVRVERTDVVVIGELSGRALVQNSFMVWFQTCRRWSILSLWRVNISL